MNWPIIWHCVDSVGLLPQNNKRIQISTFNVAPGRYLFASHAKRYGGTQYLLLAILLDWEPYLVSGTLSQFKLSTSAPGSGWNTNIDFNDSTWSVWDANSEELASSGLLNLNGGCPRMMWAPTAVTDIYVRAIVDIRPGFTYPSLHCAYNRATLTRTTTTTATSTSTIS